MALKDGESKRVGCTKDYVRNAAVLACGLHSDVFILHTIKYKGTQEKAEYGEDTKDKT